MLKNIFRNFKKRKWEHKNEPINNTYRRIKKTINVRYAEEANKSCCLSCGGALDKANIQVGECFVDLGSGKGMDVLKASRVVGSSGKVYGIDFTNEMIQVAESNRKN